MAQRIIIDGFYTDRPVAPLQELAETLRRLQPSLSVEQAHGLLVKPPFQLGDIFRDEEAASAARELEHLGARIRLLPVVVDDPSWWRDRNGDTEFARTATAVPPEAQTAPRPEPTGSPAAEAAGIPPEGGAANMFELWTDIVTRPSAFFSSPLIREGGGHPLLFAIVISVIGAVMAVPGNYVLGSSFSSGGSLTGELVAALVGTPLATLFFVFVSAVLLHIGARVVGGHGDYSVAVRIMAYLSAVNVFQVIPFIGHIAILVCYYLFSLAGLQGAYRLSPVRAGAALLLAWSGVFVFIGFLVVASLVAMGLGGLQEFLDTFGGSPGLGGM